MKGWEGGERERMLKPTSTHWTVPVRVMKLLLIKPARKL